MGGFGNALLPIDKAHTVPHSIPQYHREWMFLEADYTSVTDLKNNFILTTLLNFDM